MRLIHILTAVLLFSLFAVMLYEVSQDAVFGLNTNISQEDGANVSNLFSNDLNIISSTGEQASDLADSAPGGVDSSVASSSSDSSDIALERGSFSTVISAGRMLYTIPKLLFNSMNEFLGLDSKFISVATTLLIVLIATILVSSVLKNRLWGNKKCRTT